MSPSCRWTSPGLPARGGDHRVVPDRTLGWADGGKVLVTEAWRLNHQSARIVLHLIPRTGPGRRSAAAC